MAEILDDRIRSLVTELVESAPQAPTLPELEWSEAELAPSVTAVPPRRRVSRVLVGGLVGAVTVILVVALLVPIVADRRGRNANPAATLAEGQWVHRANRISMTLKVFSVGHTSTPNAKAEVTGTLEYWANTQNQMCVSFKADPARFAANANRDAWHALDLRDAPVPNPWTSCASGGIGVPPPDEFIVNVSRLSTEPAVLADQLRKGTTGIPALDDDNANLTGFQRVALLVAGPTAGSSPSLGTAIVRALPLIPGVEDLGPATTQSGQTGVEFADASGFGQGRSELVLDPATGALLEARNIPLANFDLNTGTLRAYMSESVAGQGGVNRVTVDAFDPIASPSVVDTRDLPANLDVTPVEHYTASIVGSVKPSISGNEVPNFARGLSTRTCTNSYYASAKSQDTDSATPITAYDGTPAEFSARLTVYCTGRPAEATAQANVMKASGLFSSVVVTYARH